MGIIHVDYDDVVGVWLVYNDGNLLHRGDYNSLITRNMSEIEMAEIGRQVYRLLLERRHPPVSHVIPTF